jgi:polysaccharide pyruvyl transferase WcaK-like protein
MTRQKNNTQYELFNGVNQAEKLMRRLASISLKAATPFVKTGHEDNNGAIIAYAAPTFGSLGDQAMFMVAMQNLRASGHKQITLLAEEKPSQRWHLPQNANQVLNPEHYFSGSFTESIRFQNNFLSNSALFIIGADVMDGHYSVTESLKKIHLLQMANTLGFATKVFGFSFNESPAVPVVRALKNLPDTVQLLARDPVSHRRLEHTLERPVRLVADLAFLLQPDPTGESAKSTLDWIRYQRAHGARVIGINANALLARGNFGDPLPIAVGLARTIIELRQMHPDLRFVLIPHDFRGSFNDVMLNRITYEIVSFHNNSLSENIFTMPSPCSSSEVKAVCGELDLVITGRMHLAIACLGQGTPAMCIGYQGKMEGLFEHFELPNMVLSPIEAFGSKRLVDMANNLLLDLQNLRGQINKYLPKVFSLARKNFE